WQSPVSGVVRVSGRADDADPSGGDGVAWRIDLHPAGGGRQELASGDIPNGGAQPFDQGDGAGRLNAIEVKAGDRVELVVLPKANYFRDTTHVELRVATEDGALGWDLARDVVADPLQGNPHDDGHGNAAVWHFLDTGDARPGAGADAALAAWERASAAAGDRV